MSYFTINPKLIDTGGGVYVLESSEYYGVAISSKNVFSAPERDLTEVIVAGRNGSMWLDNGRYNNIVVEYECNMVNATPDKLLAFRQWLLSAPSNAILYDSYNGPDSTATFKEIRLATLIGGVDIETTALDREATFTVTFSCCPERYDAYYYSDSVIFDSATPLVPIVLSSSPATFTNPSPYPAYPFWVIRGYANTGTVTLNYNGSTITISDFTMGGADPNGRNVYFDTQTQNFYTINSGVYATFNPYATINYNADFTLHSGTTTFTWTKSGSTAPDVSLYPRYYYL